MIWHLEGDDNGQDKQTLIRNKLMKWLLRDSVSKEKRG